MFAFHFLIEAEIHQGSKQVCWAICGGGQYWGNTEQQD